jgi:hypothetical protein
MEGYFEKLKSKKNLGTDFNRRYFAVVRMPNNQHFLNYYSKRADLNEDANPSCSIALKDLTFVGSPNQSEAEGGQPKFKVGDPRKLKKQKKNSNQSGGMIIHNTVMENHADHGIQIASKYVNIFIVAANKSMAHKWIAGLCLLRDLTPPPNIVWPKKFGPPPPKLFKSGKDGLLISAPKQKTRSLQGYFNAIVVEKTGSSGLNVKLKRRFFTVHDTNSPKRGSLELALCQYSKRDNVAVGMRKCRGFLFLRHITKIERIDMEHINFEHPFLAGPAVADDTLSAEAKKIFVRDQVHMTCSLY